jgi:hypothetical protein
LLIIQNEEQIPTNPPLLLVELIVLYAEEECVTGLHDSPVIPPKKNKKIK